MIERPDAQHRSVPRRNRRNLLHREPVILGLLAFAAIFFSYRWSVDLQRPGAQTPEGWWGFTDQGFYLREAVRLANLEGIPRAEFIYGPGYPALAAPFARVGKYGWPFDDPFLPANALAWLLTVGVTYLVGRRLGGELVGIASALALMLATPLIGTMTLPWNTTASLAALMLVALVALTQELRWTHGAVLGVAIGLAYSARYVDALWVAIAAVTVLLARGALSRRGFGALAGVAGGALLVVVPTLLLHWQTFGTPLTTSYRQLGVDESSFALGNIGRHALATFISPYFFPEDGQRSAAQPLVSSMFVLVLVPVGFWLAVRQSAGPRRVLVLGFGLASLVATLFYLSYWFTGPYGLGFGSVHYFKMWFPLWTIAGVLAIVHGGTWLSSRRAPQAGAG